MNSASKLLIALLAAVAAVAIYLSLGDDNPAPKPVPQPAAEETAESDPAPIESRGSENLRTDDSNGGTGRQPLREGPVERADPGQGLIGRVVDSLQRPVEDAYVAVFEASAAGLFAMVNAQRDGVVRRPLSEARTDEFGDFKLPLYDIKPTSLFEIYVIDDVHADLSRRNVGARAGEYLDVGVYELQDGNVLSGVVRAKDSGAAIQNATVQMIPPNYSFQAALVPGRELSTAFGLPNIGNSMTGMEVQTDPTGRFTIRNAPSGAVRLVAFADGYARQEKQNVIVDAENAMQLDFELSTGMAIGGLVVDGDEQPVPGAKITVAALSQVNPGQAEGLSDRDGRFTIEGLEEGPYRILVAAKGFMNPEALPPIEAGTMDEVLVLEKQGEALLTVKTASGRAVRNYAVLPRMWHVTPNNKGAVGHSFGAEMIQVTDRDLEDGKFRISGLNPGKYKAEVRARGFAMSYSEPFEIVRGGPPVEAVCILSEGGELTGVITTPQGQPIQGATVETLPNNYIELGPRNPFAAMMVWDVTRSQQTTGANGEFSLKKLTPGKYQLRVKHPEWSTCYKKDFEVREGDRSDAGQIEMIGGTRVTGIAYVEGQPTAQIEVTISAVTEPGKPGNIFNASALTGPDGTFTVPQLVPAGKYQIMAKRQSLDPANMFGGIIDMNQTRKEVIFAEGQATYDITFQLKKQ